LFVVPLTPVLGLRTFLMQYYSTVADHYLYLPMLGVGLLVAWVVRRYPSRALAGAVAGVALVLAIRSVLAAGSWANDLALWRNVVTVNPRSFAGWMVLGLVEQRQGRMAEAEAAYRRSIEVGPDFPNAREAYANFLIATGRVREAIEPLRQEVRLNEAKPAHVRPDTTMRRLLLGQALLTSGRRGEAAAEFEEVLRRSPGNAHAAAGLAEARRAGPAAK
jgi:protein O-mannosyl-transferase